ncbi:MAG TPA: hypothetical protein DCG57_06420 [Candidatus Riflebacteria bacterium]|nr:hypothetical protein [Candidatus Riflebacteria bacterium]
MQYLHPLFMLVLFAAVIHIHRLGKKALAVNLKSPEADQHALLMQQHQKLGTLVTALVFVGLLGGIIGLVKFLQVKEIFLRTYGHGFAGAIFLGLLIANIFVGKSVKRPIKQKAQENLRRFHFYLFYFSLVVALYSVISGMMVLIKGPAVL